MQSYITREDLLFSGHDISNIQDAELDAILSMASFLADEYCGQKLSLTTQEDEIFTDIYTNENGLEVYPSFLPINSVDKIEIINGINSSVSLDINSCIVDNNKGCIYVLNGVDGFIGKITYKYGYDPIPEDAKQGVALIAVSLLDQHISSKVTGFSDILQIQEYQEKLVRKNSEIMYKLKKFKKSR